MTSSTGSSVASASGNDSPADAGGLFYGMDEAGYGPNLGPLLIAVTHWRTPSAPQVCDFYRLLDESVSRDGSCNGSRLHLADSKQVNTGKYGFRSLETSALALAGCLGWETGSFRSLWNHLTSHSSECGTTHPQLPPWYDADLQLPVAADPNVIQELSGKLQESMQQSGVQLLGIAGDLVVEPRFNQLVTDNGENKGRTLSRLAFQLLRSVWSPNEAQMVLVVGDKHGGRNRYDELLSEVLADEMIFRLEEGQRLSRYRVGCSELRFQMGGEQHLPVACASIMAKYMRELSMDLFNLYWTSHCPGLKPTRGYPKDAVRFREGVAKKRAELSIPEEIFWRSR